MPFSFKSANETATADLTRIRRQWQKYVNLSFLLFFSGMCLSQTPVWSNVYVRVCAYRICIDVWVFCAGGKKKNSIVSLCSPMLMWRGSWGSAPRLLAARKFCGESEGGAGANFNLFFKRTLRNSCFCWNAGCVFPDEKHTGGSCCYQCERLVRGKHSLTLTPWMISQVGLAWKRADKNEKGGAGLLLGGSKALSWILSLEGGVAVCVCGRMNVGWASVWVRDQRGNCEYVGVF